MRATALISAALLGASVLGALPAAAQTTAYAADNGGGPSGPNNIPLTVPVTAHVGSMCSVVTGGSAPGGASFGTTVQLGDSGVIVDANGHLLSGLSASTTSSASVSQSFQINCSGAGNAFTVTATPLATNPVVTAPTGYANTVNYTAEVDFATTGASTTVDQTEVSDSVTHAGNFPAGVSLANTAGDVTIKAYGFNTAHTATDVLVASPTYQGAITVTISAGT